MKSILIVTLFAAVCGSAAAARTAPEVREAQFPVDVRCCTGSLCVLPLVGEKSCEGRGLEARNCPSWEQNYAGGTYTCPSSSDAAERHPVTQNAANGLEEK